MNLQELIDKKFGIKTRAVENPKLTSLGTTAQVVLDNNPNRLAWIIVNLSTAEVYLALRHDVSPTKGVRLDASGGSASMVWDEDFQATGWAIWGVATAANSPIYSLEVVIQE